VHGSVSGKPSPTRGEGQRLLVVVDDPATDELLSTTLELAGYQVVTATTVAEALVRLARESFDLVVLDMTPDLNGFTGFPRLAAGCRPPLLFLTACESLGTLVPGLGMGGTDYVTKPFRIAEVLARAHTLLCGSGAAGQERAPRCGDLILDDVTCQARRGLRALELSPAEYRLLRQLLANRERVLSKEQISRHVWGDVRADNAIEKLVSRLRRKVDVEAPQLIHTRKGFGYWLGQ
jgi:two-component system, OmpR family, response regulator